MRYLDPTSGRFLTEDPAKDGLNWFSYCNGNPVKFTDPWGLAYIDGIWVDEYNFYLTNGNYISRVVGVEGLSDHYEYIGWTAIDLDGNIYQIRSDNVTAMEVFKEDGTYSYSSDPNFINGLGYFGEIESVSNVAQYQTNPSINNELDSPFYTDIKFTNMEWGEAPTVEQLMEWNGMSEEDIMSIAINISGGLKFDNQMARQAAKALGITGKAAQREFTRYLEHSKGSVGKPNNANFTWEELIELGKEFLGK